MVIRKLTKELDRAEVESWRKLIRALSHELNNSLAPMSSTLYSVRQMLGKPAHQERLKGALGSLERRVDHLGEFLSSYAGLARLPLPRPRTVAWGPFLQDIGRLAPFSVHGDLPYSTRPGGTGLGLALSRDIVVGHGGWLSLDAREGGGAVVQIWLPGP